MATSRFEKRSTTPVTLLLPDVDCGVGYWLDQWAASRIDCHRVELGQAYHPDRNGCVSRLDRALRGIDAPVVLVGHGLGALTIAAWARLMGSESEAAVAGALLVAPSDPVGETVDSGLTSFAPVSGTVFCFPAMLVASANDPMMAEERAFSIARQWGAGFASFGQCGHFRPVDGLGRWPQGEEMLDRFIDLIELGDDRRVVELEDLLPLTGGNTPDNAAFQFRP